MVAVVAEVAVAAPLPASMNSKTLQLKKTPTKTLAARRSSEIVMATRTMTTMRAAQLC